MGYVEEPDGTRVYDHGKRYKPLALHERKYRVLKPVDADERGATRFAGKWWYPLDVLPDAERALPWTRPDEEGGMHQLGCLCYMCRNSPRVRKLKRKRLGLKHG